MARAKRTSDAVKILRSQFIGNDAKREQSVRNERQKMEIAMQIYELRQQANLSQQQLAKLIGTTQSVISRLEDADYRGHSIEMLRRIAQALHCRVEISIVPDTEYAAG
jgi:ribosome-binding protein aMBF1 (putative translation factor)